MADGFLGRWSRRKLDAKEGKPLEEQAAPAATVAPAKAAPSEAAAVPGPQAFAEARAPASHDIATPASQDPPPEPPPTLADVAGLTPQSDFRRFIARDVAADVKSAAMKKLFADPHFNVMDRLDTYIDDYSQPDPIPESMLRQLASAQFLGLFREDDAKGATPAGASGPTDGSGPQSVAQSQAPGEGPTDLAGAPSESVPEPATDAHADLRLQQDDAPEGGEPGRGAG